MPKSTIIPFLVVSYGLYCGTSVFASESQALALLKGVEQERMKYDCFTVTYTETRKDEGNKTVTQIVDFDHGKMRKVHLKTRDFSGWSEVLNGDEFYRFVHKPNEDVALTDSNSGQSRYSGLYDPRILGLTSIAHFSSTVHANLLFGRLSGFTVEDTTLDGKPIKRVSVSDGDQLWEMYIDEPGFRLWKTAYTSPALNTSVNNRYDDPNLGPFPSESHVVRIRGKKTIEDRTFKVTGFEVKKSFPPDTFTYKGMDLPLNAAVVDYRIHRRAGYWDGEKLVDDPVRMSAQERREWEKNRDGQPLGNIVRYVLTGAGILMIGYALYSMRQKRLKERE